MILTNDDLLIRESFKLFLIHAQNNLDNQFRGTCKLFLIRAENASLLEMVTQIILLRQEYSEQRQGKAFQAWTMDYKEGFPEDAGSL